MLAAVVLISPAQAEEAHRTPRIGVLVDGPSTGSNIQRSMEGLRKGLAERGYIEGKSLVIEWRFSENDSRRLPEMARELSALHPDVVLSAGSHNVALVSSRQFDKSMPIVMVGVPDPVAAGFAASLSRPGGNMTGIASSANDISTKFIEILKTAVPGLARVGMISSVPTPLSLASLQSAARSAGVAVVVQEIDDSSQVETATRNLVNKRSNAIIVVPGAFLGALAPRINQVALGSKLPTIYFNSAALESGGLLSYGPNTGGIYFRAAAYVDRILKGAKPAELPIELPGNPELVINLKTAKQIGLKIPRELLLRADRVIE